MDQKVLEAQKWYNSTYTGKSWFTKLTEDGITGYGTCLALCKALQYEIGVSGIDGMIGAGTLSACPTVSSTTTNKNLVKIVQCGFYCKGYECGSISGTYDAATKSAATLFRTHAGFPSTNGSMPPIFIKALLNTDAFVPIAGSKTYVRSAQQYLNNSYIIKLPNWGLIPCNGVADRNMMKAIIAALQYEEAGQTTSGVDGIYGNNTLNNAPTISLGTSKNAFVRIAQMCLMCMMEIDPGLDGIFNSSFQSKVKAFQSFYCLSSASSGVIDIVTWASLLSSKGLSTRPALACDASTQLNASMAKALYSNGYRYIGRYLTGTVGSGATERPKNLTRNELNTIFDAGLNVFAIFQEGAVNLTKFTYEQGRADAATALEAARSLGVPYGEIIYFAIDYDMTDENVTSNVIPYFRGIRKTINNNYNRYRIGIYGSRNVCSRVAAVGYSVSSFVSDMSTGFSGNLGYKIPDNWAFDQFYEYTFTGGGTSFGLDKVAYSGRYSGFGHIESHTSSDPIPVPTDEILVDRYREILKLMNVSPALGLSLDRTFVVDTPILYVEYKAGCNVNLTKDPDSEWTPALDIVNGSFDSNSLTHTQEIIDQISSETTVEFNKNGGVSVINKLSSEIGNGKVSVGIGVEGNRLKVIYQVEETVLSTEEGTYVLSTEITMIFRNMPTPEGFREIVQAALISGVIVAAGATGYVCALAFGSAGLAIAEFIIAVAAIQKK